MSYYVAGLSVIIIGIINGLKNNQQINNQERLNKVYLPKYILVIGIISSVFFLIPVIILLLTNMDLWLILVFSAFSLLGATLIIAFINCKISYNDQCFEVKNFFGVKRRYTYDRIVAITNERGNTTLYLEKHKVRIDEISVGKKEFISYLKRQYRKLNAGNSIPNVKIKSDIFNGNIRNPGEFLFIYILIGALLLAATISMIVVALLPHDYENRIVTYAHYEFDGKSMKLYSENDSSYYSIPEYNKLLTNSEDFLLKCDNGERFLVSCEVLEDRYYIQSIKDMNGKVYLSEIDMEKYNVRNATGVCMVFGILLILFCSFVIVSIYVGRHPEKFSKRFIRLFFKPSYINYP